MAIFLTPPPADQPPQPAFWTGWSWRRRAIYIAFCLTTLYLTAAGARFSCHENRAETLIREGKPGQAVEVLGRALLGRPRFPLARRHFAITCINLANGQNRAGDAWEAEDLLKRCLLYDPQNLDLLTDLGLLYLEQKRFDEAADLARQAIAIDPGYGGAHCVLGKVYYDTDRLAEAGGHLEICRKSDSVFQNVDWFEDKVGKEARIETGMSRSRSEHFLIKFEGTEDPELAEQAARMCEDARDSVGLTLGLISDRPVTVILYSEDGYDQVSGHGGLYQAYYDGKIRIRLDDLLRQPGDLRDTVYHEYAHALIHEIAGPDREVPRWVHEGIARLVEPNQDNPETVARWLIEEKLLLPLQNVEPAFASTDSKRLSAAYYESWLAIRFMSVEYGLDAPARLVKNLGQGLTLDQALTGATGHDLDSFDRQFRQWVNLML